ncbi:hypothetical protein D1AOALGA4SA_12061 [Olavius algarvensis Delta 1 endosymbiont]|nr:hypothetical protein D1AOALGA4SA_12061 [Olavius algarvensis Delta 1 endosymbiont]
MLTNVNFLALNNEVTTIAGRPLFCNRFIEPAHKLKIDQNKLQNCRSNILNLVNVL